MENLELLIDTVVLNHSEKDINIGIFFSLAVVVSFCVIYKLAFDNS